MEIQNQINFLENPKIKASSLDYVEPVKVYANLFEIKLTKQLVLYQYPYEVTPQISEGNVSIRKKIFKMPHKQLKEKYGVYFISGDSLYSLKKVEEIVIVKSSLPLKKEKKEYKITIDKFQSKSVRTIKQENLSQDPLSKQLIELLIKDIILTNPNVERFKDTYIMVDKGEEIDVNEESSFTFYPGYKTSFVETDRGNFLNVVLTHKFIRNQTILDYIERFGNINNKSVQEEINAELIGRSFKVCYSKANYRKRNYIINEILFDRNPVNQHFSHEGVTYTLVKYYQQAYNIDIKDKKQPLILVRKKGPQDNMLNLYFIPELCNLVGIDEEDVANGLFMKKVSECTKMDPNEKVRKTNEFVEMLKDNTENLTTPEKWSSKKKADYYGIQVNPVKDLFNAYYMKATKLIDAKNNLVKKSNKGDEYLVKKNDMINWLFFYNYEENYDDADFLNKNLKNASRKYGIEIKEPTWVDMKNKDKAEDWIKKANEYFVKGKRKFDFALFLLGENTYIYPKLKVHSLCTNGYISQIVKAESLRKKGILSVCSKILLQINAKLGGALYKIKPEKPLSTKKIMLIGVDSSKHKDKNNYGTGIAMVATIDDSFNEYYNKVYIVKRERPKKKDDGKRKEFFEGESEEESEENSKEETPEEKYRQQFYFCINEFIDEAVEAYKKNNKGNKPDWLIIYRQGVSLQQKDFLKNEIREINNTCKTKNIPYYYILVNTKSTFKFFQPEDGYYYNPYSGLLVLDGVINRNFFEFYIQPQEVTQGSATPTAFHVAYGNLNFPEIIPKLTFDLCHLYSNWQGSVRMPNVIKCAEKLSKMTAKYKLNELNERLRIGQAYL